MYNKTVNGLIKRISDKVRCRADSNLKEHDLTLSQARILRFLCCNGGQCTQKQLRDFLQVSHPTVVGLVSRMEQNDYVTTVVMPQDKRNKVVVATDKANAVSQELQDYMQRIENTMLQGLSDKQQQDLAEMLQIVYANLG